MVAPLKKVVGCIVCTLHGRLTFVGRFFCVKSDVYDHAGGR